MRRRPATASALDRVHGLLYRELHALARRQLGPHKDATAQHHPPGA
ncbi:MAG: hypothetical protein LKM39_13360 [Chiayiivirga sp.]|nr:hypothetical protein [Chiayiivirga sp.]